MTNVYKSSFIILLLLSTYIYSSIDDDYKIQFEIPFGIGKYKTTLIQGSYVNTLFSIESFKHEKVRFHGEVIFPKELEVIAPKDIIVNKHRIKVEFPLRTENDIWYYLVKLKVSDDADLGEYSINIKLKMGDQELNKNVTCFISSKDYLQKNVVLNRFSVPCNIEGKEDLTRKKDTFVSKDLSNRFLGSFSMQTHPHGAWELIGIELENKGDFPVTLDAGYFIYDSQTNSPVEWLKTLKEEQGIDIKGIFAQIFLEPKEKVTTILKISPENDEFLSGEYIQKFKLKLFGLTEEFLKLNRPLYIKKVRKSAALSTLFSFVISLIGIICIFIFKKYLFSGLTSREYILIGLYAAVAFSLVSIPQTICHNIIYTFLGPFSFFITGLFNEVVFYILLISLIVLLPRRGIVICFIFTKFLLGAVILGNISILSLLWFPMRGVLLECAVFISGIYENNKKCHVLWIAFVFGVFDAFLSWNSFNMTMFFYRLYFANWYILMYIIVAGFLYTFIAVPIGIKIGNRLKKVSID